MTTTPAARAASLDLRGVSLSFRGVKAISDLSFAVRAGEICALIGPNGAGKSSLLNILNGVYVPDAGEIRLDGELLGRIRPIEAARRGVARSFQNNALFKRMSVIDNVIAGAARHGRATLVEEAFRLPRARAQEAAFRAEAERVLDLLHLSRHRDTVVGGLPYGAQKRVELGRALISRPRILLLDEPLAGMNAAEKREMADFVARINATLGTTVVLIEHDIGIVLGLARHVVALDYGRKVGDGTPAEIRANPEVIAAYLGTVH